MRKIVMLTAALALWGVPALASHIDPQTFATVPADPPAATAVATAPVGQAGSAFPFYTPLPPAAAHRQFANPARGGSEFPFYTPMPPTAAPRQTASPGNP